MTSHFPGVPLHPDVRPDEHQLNVESLHLSGSSLGNTDWVEGGAEGEAFEQRLLQMGTAVVGRADGEVGRDKRVMDEDFAGLDFIVVLVR